MDLDLVSVAEAEETKTTDIASFVGMIFAEDSETCEKKKEEEEEIACKFLRFSIWCSCLLTPNCLNKCLTRGGFWHLAYMNANQRSQCFVLPTKSMDGHQTTKSMASACFQFQH